MLKQPDEIGFIPWLAVSCDQAANEAFRLRSWGASVQFLTSAANELRPRAARFSARRSPGALLLIGIACLWALPFAASPAQALCTPPAGPGTPAAGTTVTCNTVTNQNPGVTINGGMA